MSKRSINPESQPESEKQSVADQEAQIKALEAKQKEIAQQQLELAAKQQELAQKQLELEQQESAQDEQTEAVKKAIAGFANILKLLNGPIPVWPLPAADNKQTIDA